MFRVRVVSRTIWSTALACSAVPLCTATAEAQQWPRWPSDNLAPSPRRSPPPVRRAPIIPQSSLPVSSQPVDPLVAVVSISRQTVAIYDGTEKIAEAPISSGQPGHRTPTGVFSILQKARYHESNLYSNAPMPFMQRLTWSGVALHAGQLPGYPASHGCIRLPHQFAERLFGMTRVGARVIVAHDQAVPAAIAHQRLPVPRFTEVDEPPATTVASALSTVTSAVVTSAQAAPLPAALLAPKKAAEFEKRRAAKAVGDHQAAAKAALQASAGASAAAEDAKAAIRVSEMALDEQRRILRRAQDKVMAAQNDEDRVQAWASLAVAEEDLGDAMRAVDAARRTEEKASDHALGVAVAARKAEDAAIAAEEQARIAAKGTEPLTVFVSRKENRAFLRQGLQPLMEGEVAIEDMTVPIGTHVFTAVDADDGGAALKWSVVTVPEAGQPDIAPAAALGRVTFAPKLADEIARRAWPGVTIIISDHGISGETGKGTDFVVLTR